MEIGGGAGFGVAGEERMDLGDRGEGGVGEWGWRRVGIWGIEGRVGGWVRVFDSREKLHRWMDA